MRVLLITDEEWNDAVYGNNVLTNWFDGFGAEFAQIYCSPGLPCNNICDRYFQITDMQMVRSFYTRKRAGGVIHKPLQESDIKRSKVNAQRISNYKWLKQLSLYIHTPMMIIRDAIWSCGRYDMKALKMFIDDFSPEVVFCPRMYTPKLGRLEKIVSSMTRAPFVAFTADNEVSLNCYSWSPLFWLRRFAIHKSFAKHVLLYRHYFMFSNEQAQEYNHNYKLPTSCLYKCGSFTEKFKPRPVNKLIRMVYAGRLYCNRWKTLSAIGEALKVINKDCVKVELDVYTLDKLTKKQARALSTEYFINLKGSLSPAKLAEEYQKADVALHVESFDKRYRLETRVSFSTKIIDLMLTGCAILAVCWNRHAGYQYLKENDAAFCVDNYDDILPLLRRLVDNQELIRQYAEKAYKCGKKHHCRKEIQAQIKRLFENVVQNN